MALQNTVLRFGEINFSAQVGDIVYYSHSGIQIGGFNSTQLQNTKRFGKIMEFDNTARQWDVTVQYDDTEATPPAPGDYISFAKDKRGNTSSLLGYYASVNFVNNSTEKAELFSVGFEVSESSK